MTAPAPLSDPRTADEYADRALARASTAMSVGAFALVLMALLFTVLMDGVLDARSLPQVLLLGYGAIVGMAVSGAVLAVLRGLRAAGAAGRHGTGPDAAQAGARWLSRVVMAVPVGSTVIAVVLAATVRPLGSVLLSCAVGFAVTAQLAVLAVVQRSALRRATVRR